MDSIKDSESDWVAFKSYTVCMLTMKIIVYKSWLFANNVDLRTNINYVWKRAFQSLLQWLLRWFLSDEVDDEERWEDEEEKDGDKRDEMSEKKDE